MKITISDIKTHDINPNMFGLFFEDINYAADGGLYAEMIENRSFEFLKTTGDKDAYAPEYDGIYGWYKYPKDCPFVSMETRTLKPLIKENPHYLHLRTVRANSGFTNKSYDGLCLKKDMGYNGLFWMNVPAYSGDVNVIIEKNKDVIFKQTYTVTAEDNWKEYRFSFKSPINIRGAHLVITLASSGEADFDFISLFPEDAVMGVFRKDLADLLKDLKPGFLRFPGGCIIEGNTLENRYQWKLSVGDPKTRVSNWNRWAVHGNGRENNYTGKFSHYNQTLGLGYYEYFLLCEYIGAKALPVINVGLACQYQSTELVETTDPAFYDYVHDALDLIEFANGDIGTKWGNLRAKMGHPEPFGLEFMGIGNEQWETEKVNFFERYTIFEKAIHSRYPDMKLIGSAGPDVRTPRYEAAWSFYRENRDKKNFAYAIDEHYYMPPEWFLENTHFYDDYDRSVKVFSGEYAAHPKRPGSEKSGNTLQGAVSEAAFLTGVERNSDVVVMSSYAPLFAREGYVQWAPDMIWFDDEKAYGTPSYHVQKMYSNNMGSWDLEADTDFDPDSEAVFFNASYDAKRDEVILKLVNASDEDKAIDLDLADYLDVRNTEAFVLSGDAPGAFNSLECPDRVEMKKVAVNPGEKHIFPKMSFTVIRFGF